MTKLEILQINNQKRIDSMNCVRLLCSKKDNFIVLGQECNTLNDKPTGLEPRHKTIFNTANPRAYIHHHERLNTWECKELGDKDICAAIWQTGSTNPMYKQIMLISMYWESRVRYLNPKLMKIADYCRSKGIPMLLGSDTNCSSTLANCIDTGPRGHELEEFLAINNMQMLNQGNDWTFFTTRKQADDTIVEYKSIIDFTMASSDIAPLFSGWHVSDTPMMSDHKLVTMTLDIEPEIIAERYDYSKANWNLFRDMIRNKLPKVVEDWSIQDIETQANKITEIIQTCMNKCIPKRKVKLHKPVGWWTKDLELLKVRVDKAHKKFNKHTYNRRLREEWKMLETEYSRKCRKAKRVCWKQFTSDVENAADMAKLNKIFKKAPQQKIGMLRKANGSMCNSPEETVDLLCEHNFPESQPEIKPEVQTQIIKTLDQHFGRFKANTAEFRDPEMVKKAFASFKTNKAAGHDDIKPSVLQNLPNEMTEAISRIYDACQTIGYTPLVWRKSKVVMIPKPGKPDYTVPKAFRPISLTPFLFKSLEKLSSWHIQKTALAANPISKNQHAFKPGSSTTTALCQTLSKIESGISKKGGFSLVVFIDVSAAFDNLSSIKGINAMKERGIIDDITNWYGHYLQNRISTTVLALPTTHA